MGSLCSSKKYSTSVAAAGPKLSGPRSSELLPVIGERVRLKGLQARPELNGEEGVCSEYAESTGRWTVILDEGRREISVKTANLISLGGSRRGRGIWHARECGCSLTADEQDGLEFPLCQTGCGRRTPLCVKPSGFPHETCCQGCLLSGGGDHERKCEDQQVLEEEKAAGAKGLASDEESMWAALSLFQAIKGEAERLRQRDLDAAALVIQDRLHFWPHRLRCFGLRSAHLPELTRAGDAGCPWIALLDSHYKELGRNTFQQVCRAQAQAVTAFWRQRGARILDRGLKAGDDLQLHALGSVRSVWGAVIDRTHSQEYLDRGSTRIVHSGTLSEYTPPSSGPITSTYWTEGMGISEERATADLQRVVRVALLNKWAIFDDNHVPLYHGLAATGFSSWSESGPVFNPYPGKFGEGIYLTPSFQMACMYAFRQPRTLAASAETGLAAPRFGVTPDQRWNYLMCFQVMAATNTVEKFKGTAFTDAGDGWDLEAQISIVRNAEQAQIYGVLFCYFPRTYTD